MHGPDEKWTKIPENFRIAPYLVSNVLDDESGPN